MKHIIQILLDKGYKCYGYAITFGNQNADAKSQIKYMLENRDDLVFITGNKFSKECSFYYPKKVHELSTMIAAGIHSTLALNENFDNAFLWGLHEADKPPTLINPRPKIRLTQGDKTIDERFDDAMNICLQKEDHQTILEYIESGETFYYNENI